MEPYIHYKVSVLKVKWYLSIIYYSTRVNGEINEILVLVGYTVKSRLSKHWLSETFRLLEDDGQSWLFSLLSIAIKLPIIQISIIRKVQFFELICRSRLKKLLLNYPSRFKVQMSRMMIMISLFDWVRFTHLSEIANKVATGNWHRINVHTITWWTVKWVNGVFN